MRLPRNISGDDLAKRLAKFGYQETRQSGSHMRLTTTSKERGEHHITIPKHDNVRVGTLASILAEVAAHLGISRDELAERLFEGLRR